MKTLIALILFAVPAWAQFYEVKVSPIISTATLDTVHIKGDTVRTWTHTVTYDSCLISSGSDTMKIGDLPLGKASNLFVGQLVLNDSLFTGGYTLVESILDSQTVLLADTALKLGDSAGVGFCKRVASSSIGVGQTVFGPGLAYNTLIADTVDSATFTLTKYGGDTVGVFNIGYFASHAYESGDFVGLPFLIENAGGKSLEAVLVVDSSDVLDSLDLLLFNDGDFKTLPVRDTATASLNEATIDNVLGLCHLYTMTDLGDVRVIVETAYGAIFPLSKDKVYGRLISRSTEGMTFTSKSALTLRLKFKE